MSSICDDDEHWRQWLAERRRHFRPRFTGRGHVIGCIACGIVRPLMQLGRVFMCHQCIAAFEPGSREHVRQAIEALENTR